MKLDDHSERFWNGIWSVTTDHQARKEWLRTHGRSVDV